MAELTIEEKAKRYDEKLSNAKHILSDPCVSDDDKFYIQDLFPELVESEDERIRKGLLEHCKKLAEMYNTLLTAKEYSEVQSWIAWLEKQGKQELVTCPICGWKSEKQSEQKPVEVKPKFEIEDWIVRDFDGLTVSIKDIKDGLYYFHQGNNLPIKDVDATYHFWTIQDAKDGDVLFTSSTASHETFILKSIDEKGNAKCYFAYDSEDGFREGKYHFIGSATNCKPATKEQRDTLFAKMKEAGL